MPERGEREGSGHWRGSRTESRLRAEPRLGGGWCNTEEGWSLQHRSKVEEREGRFHRHTQTPSPLPRQAVRRMQSLNSDGWMDGSRPSHQPRAATEQGPHSAPATGAPSAQDARRLPSTPGCVRDGQCGRFFAVSRMEGRSRNCFLPWPISAVLYFLLQDLDQIGPHHNTPPAS